MRVYLDTCVWCRPFDELDHRRIIDEFRAVIGLMDAARKGELRIVKSAVLFYELSKIKGVEGSTVQGLIEEIATEEVKTSRDTRRLYEKIAKECALDAVDALHVAVAVENHVELFITTDDEILNKRECIEKYGILVRNPGEYKVD